MMLTQLEKVMIPKVCPRCQSDRIEKAKYVWFRKLRGMYIFDVFSLTPHRGLYACMLCWNTFTMADKQCDVLLVHYRRKYGKM